MLQAMASVASVGLRQAARVHSLILHEPGFDVAGEAEGQNEPSKCRLLQRREFFERLRAMLAAARVERMLLAPAPSVCSLFSALCSLLLRFNLFRTHFSYVVRQRRLNTDSPALCVFLFTGAMLDITPSLSQLLGYGPGEVVTAQVRCKSSACLWCRLCDCFFSNIPSFFHVFSFRNSSRT